MDEEVFLWPGTLYIIDLEKKREKFIDMIVTHQLDRNHNFQ